jgi:hypothetical protein
MSGKSRLQRAKGGRTGLVASGNPDVIKEAEGKEDYAKGDERKRGGRAKRKAGGKVIGLMTGGGVKPRLDRPGRKRGGAVGADRSPLSSAHMHAKPGTAPAEEENGAPD